MDSAKNKAVHAKGGRSHTITYDEGTGNYHVHCAQCNKQIGSFAGHDHAKEGAQAHKEDHMGRRS